MNAAARTAVFGAGVAVAFSAAFGVGRAADLGMPGADESSSGTTAGAQAVPPPTPDAHGHGGTAGTSPQPSSAAPGTPGHDGHASEPAGGGNPAEAAVDSAPGGLQVAQDGYRLILDHPNAAPGQASPLTFRVIGPGNQPLKGYTRTHDTDLHLIAVRRDLTGFQHVHPQLGADGTWATHVDLTAGSWRVFADFDPAGDGAPMTLGTDLLVSGSFVPQPLPEQSATATVDGYTVTLQGSMSPGADSQLTLSVSRDGRPVTDLQPYLAAYGHLVALRQGDLAYLHVHPDGEPGDGRSKAGPDIAFHTTAPSAGSYRLFLDFKHGDVVRTAEFTMTAGKEAPAHGH